MRARCIGSFSITYSSTIATSGCSSEFSALGALKLIALSIAAPPAAKHSAHRAGTIRQTANARIAARATHGTIGHATAASGIPTNTRIVEALSTTFSSSSPKNSRLAATAIAMLQNRPIGVKLSATPAPSPAASSPAVWLTTVADPISEPVNRLVRCTPLSNSHGHEAINSAAATVRTRPSSAANPESPPPANPAAQ